MAWVPAQDDMVIGTRLNRLGADATVNNIIRSARATARFFPRTAPGRFDSFSQMLSVRNEGRHEVAACCRSHDAKPCWRCPVLCATRREPIDSAARGTHRGLGLCHGRPKPDKGARLSRDPGKDFFLSVNYFTLLDRFLNDAALSVGGSRAHLANASSSREHKNCQKKA
jgi:hypothetical protein